MAVISSLKNTWWDPFTNRLEAFIKKISVELPEKPNWSDSINGSWYISKKRHALELIFLSSTFAISTYYFYNKALGPNTWNRYLLNNFIPPNKSTLMEKAVLTSLIGSLGLTLTHKILRKNVLFMLQPCHMSAALLIFTMTYPNKQSPLPHILFNIYLYTQWGGIAALLFPDLRDHKYLGETFNFFAEHLLILLAPIYMIYSKRYLVLPASVDMGLFSFFLYSFFHSPLLHICALRSGLNLNYLFTPPPIKFLLKLGSGYRLALYGTALLAMFTTRYGLVNSIIKLLPQQSFSIIRKGIQ
ncbi:TMEM164 family-domain-containing protein [Cunninghamella echinulata]|nr:TMEM164 family-domain-containing protein [Cunninghamella echinulata]